MKSNLIEVWGFKTFRPFRIYWALEEFNLKYKSYKIGSRTGETQTNEYLDMNPKGKIPFFRHNDIGISERSRFLSVFLVFSNNCFLLILFNGITLKHFSSSNIYSVSFV